MNKFLFGIIIIGLGLTLGANIVLAQNALTLKYLFPCTNMLGVACPTAQEASQCPAAYIARFYLFVLGIAGMLAFAMIIYGAIQYIISAGSTTAQSDARDRITQALFGVALLLGAYLILYTIDPALVSLKCTGLTKLTIPANSPAATSATTTPASSSLSPASPVQTASPASTPTQSPAPTPITLPPAVNLNLPPPNLPTFTPWVPTVPMGL